MIPKKWVINIGIKIAENDLKLRGPGEIWGVKQHGSLNLKFTDFADLKTIENARIAASDLLNTDPALSSLPHLRAALGHDTIPNISLD